MKKTIIGLTALLMSCAPIKETFIGRPTGNEYKKAFRYPNIEQCVTIDVRDRYIIFGYDLDKDRKADVMLAHLNIEGNISENPYEYIWVGLNKEGKYETYARQTDPDMDGDIDFVSGNVKRMNKWLDKLE